MEIQTKRARRTAAEWQRVIDEQKRSGLSQEAFCRQNDIGYSSFHSWKAKLSGGSPPMANERPHFIELPPLVTASALSWDIELDLGQGTVLRLRRTS